MAQNLSEHFPLFQTLRLSDEAEKAETQNVRANFAIVNLAVGKVEEVAALLQQLPKLLQAGSPVFFIGFQPARWLDMVLGSAEGWWLYGADQTLRSPQLSLTAISEQLQTLPFSAIQPYEFAPEQESGIYVLSAFRAALSGQDLPDAPAKNWLLLIGEQESDTVLAHQLSQQLIARGQALDTLKVTSDLDLLQTLSAAKTTIGGYHHIVHLAGLGHVDAEMQTERCWLAAEIVQACEASASDATLWLCTQNVASLWPMERGHLARSGQDARAPEMANDAALWGLGRCLMNEASNYRVQLLDLASAAVSPELLSAMVEELLNGDAEQEVFLNNDGSRFAPRLRSRDNLAEELSPAATSTGQTLQLSFKLPGQLRNLQWQGVSDSLLADDEIEIDVKATGLNFRDVMYTLGLLSDEAVENGFVGPTLGLEFAGRVTQTGKAVTQFKEGDEVVGLGPASFSNRVRAKANALAFIPDGMAYAAAATIPSTFFTVYYALHYQARLQPGEKVLIHGAAGGVGIAAIQVAQWLGAEIYATAGSAEKRDFLSLLGVQHIYDSRTLQFAEDILADTDQRGVDVVLNSLAGEAINRNFQVLKPFGRFLELGKRDFYENTPIGLRPFRNNISYFGIDVDQLMQVRPDLTRQLFGDMMQLFHDGVLHPLPYTVFDANQVIDAFRYMQQAKQIGKIVVTYDNGIYAKAEAQKAETLPLALDAEASYLVTGGLGGFGLRTAQWLVEKGARHLILISRSGAVSAEAKSALAEFKQQGIKVKAAACDVADKAALTTLLASCRAEMPPLKGIVHAAAVIEDGLARNLDYGQMQRVMQPKIEGAWHLHELTKDFALDLFILYSSVTTLFGNPGQSNYVAANLWLEALAAHRRQQGLAATCVCWGAIDDVGYLTRNEKIKEALQSRMGGAALPAATALSVLEKLLQQPSATSSAPGVMAFDWKALSAFLPVAKSPKFRELALHSPNTDNHEDHRADIKRMLDELSEDDLRAAFTDILKEELSQILLVNKDKIDPNHSMYDMGLDSLMGVELMIAIEARFDVQIPVMALSEAPTLNKLASRLISQLRGNEAVQTEAADTLINISDLSKRHGTEATEAELSALAKSLETDKAGRIIH
jgi:NADPH:quinone reductase-like Zn-dependent oxidoreductase/acyl carrier protein